jgi:drug/metabolite transporter (DMT)-like permease
MGPQRRHPSFRLPGRCALKSFLGAPYALPLTLALVNLVWAGSFPAMALALPALPPSLLSLVRLGVAALVLSPWWFRPAGAWLRSSVLLSALVLGAIGYALPLYLEILGLSLSTPAVAAIAVALEPVFTTALAARTLGQPVGHARAAALALAFLGAWAVAGFPRPGVSGYLAGDLALLGSVLCFATYNALMPRLVRHHDARPLTAATLAGAAVAACALWLWQGHPGLRAPLSPTRLFVVAYLALPATAGAYYLWTVSIGRVAVAFASLFLYLQPVFGVVLSMVVVGTRPAASFYLGAALILLALHLGRAEATPVSAPRAGG